MTEKANLRAIAHYLFSFFILMVYGGQVCPFIDSLSLPLWAVTLAIILTVAYLARTAVLMKRIQGLRLDRRVRGRFLGEGALFMVSGIAVALSNFLFFGFPPGSGAKIAFGFIGLGFFAAADLALQEERKLSHELNASGINAIQVRRMFPVTWKFSLAAIFSLLLMTGAVFLVMNKDLLWLSSMAASGASEATRAVLTELVFVGTVFLAEILNLILSYAKNLSLFFNNENDTLGAVSTGDLDRHVPVSTSDEFGVMARYTNSMIEDLRARTEELQQMQDVTIMALKDLAETRDNETGMHILRTQRYVKVLADQLRSHPRFSDALDVRTIDLLFKSAPLHDIGKVGVRDAILLKPGRLTPEEFEEMKKHTSYGRDALAKAERMMGTSSFLRLAREIAYSHHEKWNGSGYPLGLYGEEIPVSGRLMAVADVYDALVFKRVYKDAMSHDMARNLIVQDSGKHFDPAVVDAFMEREDEFIAIAREFSDEAQT